MAIRHITAAVGCCLLGLTGLYAARQPFHQYPGVEYPEFETPPDWQEKTEWAFARLMYPPGWNDGYRGRFDGDWRQGLSLWTQDYPRADRHFSEAVRRLTRIDVRSVEQPVNLDRATRITTGRGFTRSRWASGASPKRRPSELRDYLLRGGFFMADDFHGNYEWEMFEKRMQFVFPDRPIVDIQDNDAIFHTVFDLDERFQVPGQAHLRQGCKICGERRHGRSLARHLRRQGPHHGGHLLQFRSRRRVGVGR